MEYYKVVDDISQEIIINTSVTNYSVTLPNRDRYKKIFDYISLSSQRLDLPLDFYFTLSNNIALIGQPYLDNFPIPVNGKYRVSDFISQNNEIYSKYLIEENNMLQLIQDLISLEIGVFQEGFYLWEYLYEKERMSNKLPSRYKSFFLFDNIKDCEYYIKKHKRGGVICKVELISTDNIFNPT